MSLILHFAHYRDFHTVKYSKQAELSITELKNAKRTDMWLINAIYQCKSNEAIQLCSTASDISLMQSWTKLQLKCYIHVLTTLVVQL